MNDRLISLIKEALNSCGEGAKLNQVKNLLKESLSILQKQQPKQEKLDYNQFMEETRKGLTTDNFADWRMKKKYKWYRNDNK